MGIIVTKVYFTGEPPALKTVIERLEQLTAEKIICDYLEDDKGLIFSAEVSSEAIDDALTLLLPIQEVPFYEIWRNINASRSYLLDVLVVVLQAMRGTCEYASSLPAAAHQPWQLAKGWYQKN